MMPASCSSVAPCALAVRALAEAGSRISPVMASAPSATRSETPSPGATSMRTRWPPPPTAPISEWPCRSARTTRLPSQPEAPVTRKSWFGISYLSSDIDQRAKDRDEDQNGAQKAFVAQHQVAGGITVVIDDQQLEIAHQPGGDGN